MSFGSRPPPAHSNKHHSCTGGSKGMEFIMPVIKMDNVTVTYRVGDIKGIGFKDYIIRKVKRQYSYELFTAVDGVSFELEKGDFLGIIGNNGAGKSTLLKVISKIMRPSSGKAEVNGVVAPLLELGAGFDFNMTLKENVFLRGALMGYTEDFITEKYEEIIDFAELREFEHWFFRQMSSGMKARLAFSIACFVQPDILILDEVLSVGDEGFKEKSEKRMKEIIKSGVTTLFVAHSLKQIRSLSTKVLWLDKGKQMAFGDAKTVCDQYAEFLRKGKG